MYMEADISYSTRSLAMRLADSFTCPMVLLTKLDIPTSDSCIPFKCCRLESTPESVANTQPDIPFSAVALPSI